MTGPFFPSVDSSTLRLRDQHLPQRLQSSDLVELIQDTVGSMFTGATYNDTLGTIALPALPVEAARMYRNTDQAGPSAGAGVQVALNATDYNRGGAFDTATVAQTIKVLKTGFCLVNVDAWVNGGTTGGERIAGLLVNGAVVREVGAPSPAPRLAASWPLQLAVNDLLTLRVSSEHASTTIKGSAANTGLGVLYLGAPA